MPSYIDTKYVNLVSSRLPLFKRKHQGLYNFRCPFCGDSQKSKTKARGYPELVILMINISQRNI